MFLDKILTYLFYIYQQIHCLIIRLRNRHPPKLLPPIKDDCLLLSATTLAARIRTKKITSVEVVKSYIRRIEEVNEIINAVVGTRFEEALKEAEAVDLLIAEGSKTVEELEKEKPFLGVPFTTKDGISVKGLPLDAGLVCKKGVLASEDALAVKQMKEAGAICIANTNVPEMLMFWDTSNLVYGTTNNPYDCRRIPGGSSGGEGAIIASCGSVIGVGSDIGGSIRIPAHVCGIFGHKATGTAIPPIGVFPVPKERELIHCSLGPMTRYAVDLLPLTKILLPDKENKFRLNEPVDLKKLKIFYMDDRCGGILVSSVDADIKKALQRAVEYFGKTHGNQVTKISLENFDMSFQMWGAKTMEKKASFAEQLLDGKGKVNPYQELIKALMGTSQFTIPALLMCFIEEFQDEYEGVNHKKILKICDDFYKKLEEILGEDGILLCPTHPTPAVFHKESYGKWLNFTYTGIFNATEMPATHVPLARTEDGLPIGIQVAALRNNDRLCLAAALELEKAFGGWVPPPTAIRN